MSETSPGKHDIPVPPSSTAVPPASRPVSSPRAILLPERALLAVTGKDAEHFLHNLLTADIAGLEPGRGTLAALLTPQGKILAEMLVFDASDGEPLYLIDVAQGFAEVLLGKLARYRLRAEVTIDRVPAPTAIAVCLDGGRIEGDAFYTFADPRHAALGHRLYGPEAALASAMQDIEAGEPALYHARRVGLGIPEGGRDYIPPDTFPHEANLDQLGGVDFTKGCYIGQEVVSRMQHRGMARTRAVSIRFLNGFGVMGGAEVRAGERSLGRVGESAGDRAIAILRLDRLQEALGAGTPVTAGGVPVEIEKPQYANFMMPLA